jgi:hypothetical protein
MARPKTNTVEYFPMYAHTSRTCEMLEAKYGIVGYAFFYKLLQLLATEDGHYYDASDPMSLEFLEQKLCGGKVSVTEIIETLCKWNKLDRELWQKKIIWYQGFVDTLIPVYKKREREIPNKEDVLVKLGLINKNKLVSGTETYISGTETPSNLELPQQLVAESTQSKVKESKLEGEKKEKRETPSLQKIKNYCLEKNYRSNPEKFYYKHQETGWIDKNGNSIIDWQARLDRFENEDFPKAEIKTIASFNATKAQDFGINQAQYNSYIAPLRIKINSNKSLATIACPSAFHIIQIRNGEHGCPIDENILKKVLKVNRVAYEDYDKNYDKNIDAMA